MQELQYNATTLTRIAQTAQKNLEGPKRTYTTIPLLLASTELLVANRFIDGNGRFYKGAGAYLNIGAAINERLTLWPSRPMQTDKWLVGAIEDKGTWPGWKMKSRTATFSDLVTKARHRLLTRP